jgi:hypothetical protein
MLGVHLVEHGHGEVRHGLTARDGLGEAGDDLVRAGEVMGHHTDRPLLGRRDLLPVGVAQTLDHPGGLGLGLELLG